MQPAGLDHSSSGCVSARTLSNSKSTIVLDESDGLKARRLRLDSVEKATVTRAILDQETSAEEVLIDKFNASITRSKFRRLRPGVWLDDEIINFYMDLLNDRDNRLRTRMDGQSKPSKFLNSHFYASLSRHGYLRVSRYSKTFDVFAQEKIFCPINLNNNHWVMAVIFLDKKEIHYYDSFRRSGFTEMNNLLSWIDTEALIEGKLEYCRGYWTMRDGRELETPRQSNGVDCGVFAICCASYLADNLPLDYRQEDIDDHRLRIGSAILRGELPY